MRATEQRKREADRQQSAEKRAADQRERAARSQRNDDPKRADAPSGKREADKQQADRPTVEKRADTRTDARAGRHDEARREREKLSVDQRTRLRAAFQVNNRARIRNARFARRIGSHVPRSVRLLAVPAAVFAVFPYYRDYRYVVVDDDICIVDPVTYEIVDVIDEGTYPPSGNRQQTAQLGLTPAQRTVVLDSIPADFPQADVRLRLALGADIPDRVQLLEFAPIVLDTVSVLRDFRFIVAQDSVVIVDPRDRSIALVLER